jgi:DNA-binding transcriptional LysR family regulator
MEIAQFRALLALRDSASLTAAGKHLDLSTSAIFCQIRQLEEEVGKKLYQQVGKKSRLTDTGELLAKYALRMVAMHDNAVSSIRDEGSVKRKLLRIGCGPNSSVTIVPHLLRAFLARHPNTDIRVVTSGDNALLRDLRLGILDIVFMSLPAGEADLIEEPLWSYEMVLVAPPGSGRSAECISRLNSKQLPFILFRRAVVTEIAFQQFCDQLDIEPNVVIENDEPDSIKQLVKLGLGMTVLPEWSVLEDRRKRRLSITRLKHGSHHNYGVLCRRNGYRARAVEDILTVARTWQAWWPLAASVREPI